MTTKMSIQMKDWSKRYIIYSSKLFLTQPSPIQRVSPPNHPRKSGLTWGDYQILYFYMTKEYKIFEFCQENKEWFQPVLCMLIISFSRWPLWVRSFACSPHFQNLVSSDRLSRPTAKAVSGFVNLITDLVAWKSSAAAPTFWTKPKVIFCKWPHVILADFGYRYTYQSNIYWRQEISPFMMLTETQIHCRYQSKAMNSFSAQCSFFDL